MFASHERRRHGVCAAQAWRSAQRRQMAVAAGAMRCRRPTFCTRKQTERRKLVLTRSMRRRRRRGRGNQNPLRREANAWNVYDVCFKAQQHSAHDFPLAPAPSREAEGRRCRQRAACRQRMLALPDRRLLG